MGFGLSGIIGVGSQIAGALFDDSDEVEAENRRLQAEARGLYGQSRDEISRTQELTLSDIDAANLLLEDLEPDMLAGLDEGQRIALSQILLDQEEDRQADELRLASAGLDASTVVAGMQRGRRLGQAQELGQVTSAFAGRRSSAILQARSTRAGGLYRRAEALTGFGMARAGSYQDEANLVANTRIEGSGVGAAIGEIGGSISNALYNHEMGQLLENSKKKGEN